MPTDNPTKHIAFLIPGALAIAIGVACFLQSRFDLWAHIRNTNTRTLQNIHGYERQLEDQSRLARTLIPLTQTAFIPLGLGNEKVYLGKNGWLFLRHDIDYLTGPGFLSSRWQTRRAAEGNEYTRPPQPDPRIAIRHFHEQLAARDIQLILVPVPPKSVIHPEHFWGERSDRSRAVQNASYAKCIRDLTDAGVHVFDPTAALKEALCINGLPQFLATDTHWTPASMEHVARKLAARLDSSVTWSKPKRAYTRKPSPITNTGDTAAMLRLPDGANRYPPETVSIRQVLEKRTGQFWRPVRRAEILLLGDSFTNIYSLPGMGWGQAAGFAEQLSFTLQRPVDTIIQNDKGAGSTRNILAQRIARGDDVLSGKKVVIWEFAAREFAFGDWFTANL